MTQGTVPCFLIQVDMLLLSREGIKGRKSIKRGRKSIKRGREKGKG
jgi:hypothetical protein